MDKDRVIIFDTTLRDAEQTPGASLTVPDKLEIARQLARLKVDVIEAGFPISSNEDFEAVHRIGQEVEGPVICGLARVVLKDIDRVGEALGDERDELSVVHRASSSGRTSGAERTPVACWSEILSWSFIKPSRTISGRGGQPGM